jgi:hypothetical protein
MTRPTEHASGLDDKGLGGDVDVDMPDDDWMIDDIGLLEEDNDKPQGGGLVKEMGVLVLLCIYWRTYN